MADRLLLSLEEIRLSFGGKPLFEGLSLHLMEGDKISLVGKNGAGKTTLMRLMIEELELDGGRRFMLPGTRVGYLAQKAQHLPGQTVRDFVLSGLPKAERGPHNEYLADIVLGPLGLNADEPMEPLSGGQLRRAALGRALVMDPDLLLLDEPTNHLDLTAIEWLESFLAGFRGAVVCVSHDRAFLAAISRKVFWLDRGTIRVCPTGYGQFDEWVDQQIAQEARELQNLQKKVEAEHGWTQGGVTARRKRNVRRIRELGKLREKLQKDKAALTQRRQKIELDALETVTASKMVAEFKQVRKYFERSGKRIPILDEFDFLILKGDRIGILGKNGSGKSTFVKLLAGELEPDGGRIWRSKTVRFSYFDQNRSELDPNETLWSTLCPDGGEFVFLQRGEERKPVHVCGYLKRFLFDPKQARDKVSTLSGGQQNRLLLAKILADPGNVLILDEPTNDLDMDTLDMLQDMLADYDGTLIVVSHDRDFLDRTITEVLAFEGDAQVESHPGGYSDYARRKGKLEEKKGLPAAAKPEARKGGVEPLTSNLKLTYGEEIELKKLPARLESLNRNLEAMKLELDDAGLYAREPIRFDKLMADYSATKQAIADGEERWLELEARRETA